MEETAFENGRISDFQWLVTLTLDRIILHTVMHHSSASTYKPNLIEIEQTFCGRTGGHFKHIIRSTRRSRPNNCVRSTLFFHSLKVNLHDHLTALISVLFNFILFRCHWPYIRQLPTLTNFWHIVHKIKI